MNNLFIGIGAWIKGHVVATVVISTVVVGGAVATPIIINNIEEQNKPRETEKQPEVNTNNDSAEQEEPLTCEDGYKLVDNECVKIETEEKEPEVDNNKPQEQQKPTNSEKPSNNNSNNNKPNTNSNTTKPDNKPTENKPEIEKPEEKGLSINNHIIYYNGTKLITLTNIPTVYYQGSYIESVTYNSNAINGLSKDVRNDIINNYLCKATYQNCEYSDVYSKMIPTAIEEQNSYNYKAYWLENTGFSNIKRDINRAEQCRDSMKNGTYTYTGYDDDICSAIDGYTSEIWERKISEYQGWLANAKTDRDRYQKSYNDFMSLWKLLNN